MYDDNDARNKEMVTLVATDILTPYRKGEVFSVTRAQADMLKTRNLASNDFGPINDNPRVRDYNPEKDEQLLLDNRVLTEVEHKKLVSKLHPTQKSETK